MDEVNRISGNEDCEWFVSHCVCGLVEIVAPLRKGSLNIGTIFAGSWREKASKTPQWYSTSRSLNTRYANLPEFEEERGENIGMILANTGKGLIASLEKSQELITGTGTRSQIIQNYIFMHAGEKASISELAHMLHLSNSRASHLVYELFGLSFSQLLQKERIVRAKTLLRSSDLRVGEIAIQTGFGNEFHFSRMFKKATGQSPGSFRKQSMAQSH